MRPLSGGLICLMTGVLCVTDLKFNTMKIILKNIILAMFILVLFSATSCIVLTPTYHHDNGKHSGWSKSPKNPHNPFYEKGKKKGHKEHKEHGNKHKNNKHFH